MKQKINCYLHVAHFQYEKEQCYFPCTETILSSDKAKVL